MIKLESITKTDTGVFSCRNRFSVENTGAGNATLAGRTLATGKTFNWEAPGEQIRVAYDGTVSALTFTYERVTTHHENA